MITRRQLIEKYFEFFKSKGHKVIPSASLVPANDPTVLFTTAGMHPLVPYLLGQKHPLGKRLVGIQKCIRTTDIDSVGDGFHHTFFEMLGNWSLGNYWKKEAIEFSYEFLTKELGIDSKKISVTCFKGDKDAPKDAESEKAWKSQGIKKIKFLGKEDNWWGPAGTTGPCGPDTEMFVKDNSGKEIEVWNDVFMEYNKKERIILVDGMGCIYDEDFKINEKLGDIINKFNAKKILVVSGFREKGKEVTKNYLNDAFSLEEKGIKKDNPEFFRIFLKKYNLKPEEVIYFDHSKDNVKSAESLGVKSKIYKDDKNIEEFISNNLYYFLPLKQKNVDTGMGVERTLAVLNGLEDNYMTEVWKPIIEEMAKLRGSDTNEFYKKHQEKARIIADHIKASVFIISDGVIPSNTGQGYVLRRLIRRAIRLGQFLDLKEFTAKIAESVFGIYSDYYELKENKERILSILTEEEERFNKTIYNGLMIFNKKIMKAVEKKGKTSKLERMGTISGKEAFLLYQSYGFPLELILEEAKKFRNLKVDIKGFEQELKEHQKLSKTASSGTFKSGLADHSEKTIRLHTATHLLNQALRAILGPEVKQRGSNITPERLRFDFSFPRKMTELEIRDVEEMVNKKINEGLKVKREEMQLKQALSIGAEAEFGNKYPEMVSVYFIGDFSKEICTGPHVKNTKEIGKFKIIKEEAIAAGIRRIKAEVLDEQK